MDRRGLDVDGGGRGTITLVELADQRVFCTQTPTDVPHAVLSQLGSRVQHAWRAFTPDDQKALARTYPRSTVYDVESALTSLGTGEALVTVLSERGAPTPVAWTRRRGRPGRRRGTSRAWSRRRWPTRRYGRSCARSPPTSP